MIGTRGVCLSLVVKMNGQNNKKTSDLSWYLTRILVSWLGWLFDARRRKRSTSHSDCQPVSKKVGCGLSLPYRLIGFLDSLGPPLLGC